MNKVLPLSIVITSIGEDILQKNLEKLTNSKPHIDEILVVIPYEFKNYEHINYDNVKYLFTEFKGQVLQRIHGFKLCRNKLVMQLDCDCIIDNSDIETMYQYLVNFNDQNNAIAPIYYCDTKKIPIHKFSLGFYSSLKNIITYFICGSKFSIFKMGTISAIGTNYGVDPKYMFNEIFIAEWLPGGCVMHYKKNLVLENYYPFKGKAYSEDLIHSYVLRKNNIKLLVAKNTKCFTESPFIPKSFKEFKKFLIVQIYFWKLINNKNYFKFYLWIFLNYLRFLVKR